jgi:RND family efflux transporter MFP subunit
MKTFLKAILFLVIIAAGVGAFSYLTSLKTEAEINRPAAKPTIVEVVEAEPSDERAVVSAMGTVIPAKSVTLAPEVGGKIVSQSPKLVPGGKFRQGETVLRLDGRDYGLAIEQQRAQVVRAEMELATEHGRKAVAEKEWSLIKDEVRPSEQGKKLALREVQLENAEASVTSAKSSLAKAELDKSRTVIKAPFNALVTEEFVEVGQIMGPGSRIATMVASDFFWVRAAVPMDRLSWIAIPGVNGKQGSPARVIQQVGAGETVVRDGRVIKLLGDLDPVGKMARLLIEVEDPLGTNGNVEAEGLPLLIGAYVSIEIEGPKLEDMVVLPRLAVRDGDVVWVKQDGKLAFKQARILWTKEDKVFVKGEVTPGDQVIASRIGAPVEGMKVAVEGEQTAEPGKGEHK